MESQNRVLIIALVGAVLLVLAVLLQTAVEEQLAPELVAAWVAIAAADQEIADVGLLELQTGTEFTLYAVLEAKTRNDETLYYTEAQRLSFAGEEVPATRLRPWDRGGVLRVRWFSVEGSTPFLKLENGLESFELRNFFRSNWPMAWTIPGDIDAANDSHLETRSRLDKQIFGTQHYRVRFEFYSDEEELVPKRQIASWGAEDLRRELDRFPRVRQRLQGGAGPASLFFGLSQLEPPPDASIALLREIDELTRQGIAFSSLTLLREHIRRSGKKLEELEWHSRDLGGNVPWPDAASAGDLVRVGERVVVLFEDHGIPGTLDRQDLCFDFVQSAMVREIGDVFTGEGDIELADLDFQDEAPD